EEGSLTGGASTAAALTLAQPGDDDNGDTTDPPHKLHKSQLAAVVRHRNKRAAARVLG
ncbi:unnamed protein product, partial [Coccothraustes coccothraustes]